MPVESAPRGGNRPKPTQPNVRERAGTLVLAESDESALNASTPATASPKKGQIARILTEADMGGESGSGSPSRPGPTFLITTSGGQH